MKQKMNMKYMCHETKNDSFFKFIVLSSKTKSFLMRNDLEKLSFLKLLFKLFDNKFLEFLRSIILN